MIDTIGLRFNEYVDLGVCNLWHDDSEDRGKGKTIRYKLIKRSDNGAPIKYNYYPYANHGAPFLYIEFSLPRLLYGSNVFMICDIEWAVNQANLMLPEILGVPKINLWEGILTRLDVCYNFDVGELVKEYITAMGTLLYPNRKREIYPSQGITFQTDNSSIKIYDKYENQKISAPKEN